MPTRILPVNGLKELAPAVPSGGSVALSGAACPGRSGAPASIPPRVPLMTDAALAFRGFRSPAGRCKVLTPFSADGAASW